MIQQHFKYFLKTLVFFAILCSKFIDVTKPTQKAKCSPFFLFLHPFKRFYLFLYQTKLYKNLNKSLRTRTTLINHLI